jgi:hypothetical protein
VSRKTRNSDDFMFTEVQETETVPVRVIPQRRKLNVQSRYACSTVPLIIAWFAQLRMSVV